MYTKVFHTKDVDQTVELGRLVGSHLRGGEVFELASDLGGGKTTFVRGLAEGFGSLDPVASPSFTISYVYGRPDGKELHHFDFYRLDDAGIVKNELAEVEQDQNTVVAVEWGRIVHDVLPANRIIVSIAAVDETKRRITVQYQDEHEYLFEYVSPFVDK